MADFTSFPIPSTPLSDVPDSSLADSVLVVSDGIVKQITPDNLKSVLNIDEIDNIPDDEKGISAAVRAALDKKVNIASTLVSASDSLDDIVESGFYAFSGANKGTLGRPFGASGHLIVVRSASTTGFALQIASTEGRDSRLYFRNKYYVSAENKSYWTDWHTIENIEDQYYHEGDEISSGSNDIYAVGIISSSSTIAWTVPINRIIASDVQTCVDHGAGVIIRQGGNFLAGSNFTPINTLFTKVDYALTPSGITITGTYGGTIPSTFTKNDTCIIRHRYKLTLM